MNKPLFNLNFLSMDLLTSLIGVDAIASKTLKLTEMNARYQSKLEKLNFIKLLYNGLIAGKISSKSFKINDEKEYVFRSNKYEIELSEPEFQTVLYTRIGNLQNELTILEQQIKDIDSGADKDKRISELEFQVEELRRQVNGE